MQQYPLLHSLALQVLDRLSAEAFTRTGASASVLRARDSRGAE
jgi:hypothetical protein